MPDEKQTSPSVEEIRVRSYLLWERDGKPDGKSQEHWLRAKAELEAEFEAEWRAASMGGESTAFVLPLLPISAPPNRSTSVRINTETDAVAVSAAKR